jgi:Arc/MetJ-type ribon-helix-helix transcriptional regulator
MAPPIAMDYATVKVPAPLVKRIEAIAEPNGYRSVSEFVVESVRARLESLHSPPAASA